MASTSSDDLDLWIQELGAFFKSPFNSFGNRAFQFGFSLSKWLLRSVALLLVLASCLFIASLFFTWIYFSMIPVKHFEKPVYFDFSRESPEALVSLMGNQWQYRTPSPYNLQPIMAFLTSGVPYDVDFEFTMARRVAGSQSGMLMLEATAEHSYRDKIQLVAHSKRPIEICKINFIVQLVRDCFLLVPIMTGLYRPSFRVKTRIFERFVDFQQFPISTMNLTLIRAPTHLGEIHLTDATLTFNLHLSGWRYLFYTYFWTSALFVIPLFAIIIFMFAVISYFSMKWSQSTIATTTRRSNSLNDDTDNNFEYGHLPSRSPSPLKRREKYVSPFLSTIDPKESTAKGSELKDDNDDPSSQTCTSESDSEPIRDISETGKTELSRRDSIPLASHTSLAENDNKIAEVENNSNFHIVNNEFEDDITVSSSTLETTATILNK